MRSSLSSGEYDDGKDSRMIGDSKIIALTGIRGKSNVVSVVGTAGECDTVTIKAGR